MSYFHISHFNRPCFCKGTNIKTSKYHQSQKLIDLGSWCIFQEPSDPRLPLQWKLGFLARCFQFRLVQGHKNIIWARPWKELWDKALKRIAGQGPNFGGTPLHTKLKMMTLSYSTFLKFGIFHDWWKNAFYMFYPTIICQIHQPTPISEVRRGPCLH